MAKNVFLKKMGILEAFLSHKSPPGPQTRFQKWVNGEVSDIGTSKFEFSTIKNPYNDIQNVFFDNHQKKPQKGVFLALQVLRGRGPEFCQDQQ